MSNDISSIINVVNRYALAVDSHRYSLFEKIFTEDIHCDFGGGASFTDRETLITVFAEIHAVFDATQHMTVGHTVDVFGDEANCFSYVSGRFRREIEGVPSVFESTGWYDDHLIKTADGWRIKERTSRMVTYTGDIRVMQAMPSVNTEYNLVSLFSEADAGSIRFFRYNI